MKWNDRKAEVELKGIRRQNPRMGKTVGEQTWIREYRRAVGEAQDGRIALSYDRLDRLGAVVECSDQAQRPTANYLELAGGASPRLSFPRPGEKSTD